VKEKVKVTNLESKLKHFVTEEKTRHHAEILANRIRKRFRHLSRRFKKQNIDCFRLYDWDIKEVRAVVDWYKGNVVVAEYERLQTGPGWLVEMAKAVGDALDLPKERVHIKKRRTNPKQGPRYKKFGSSGKRFEVNELDLRFLVNLDDHLDTGLFSDHRDTRQIIKKLAKGKNFLNLYSYTGSFTCAAAVGGAKTSVSVDRSANYLEWARGNLRLNKRFNSKHKMVQSDVSQYLQKAFKEGNRFNFCVVDPPSFFKDKKTGKQFDIKYDHTMLLENVLKVMLPGSLVFFSTNHQRFVPHLDGLKVKEIRDITLTTIPEDYRNKQVHRCWRIRV